MKKIIGLIPLYDDEKESYWMLPGYMKALEACGALPIMLPLTIDRAEMDACFSLCDGILMTGGHDVDPSVYHEEAKASCGVSCSRRDQMESYLFDRCYREDKPVLGICRGIQLMNALLGGTLYQDLPTEHPSGVNHHQQHPYDAPVHAVTLTPGSPLQQLLGQQTLAVNSLHHQAIRALAPGLAAMAVSEDGLVEAVCLPGKKFVWAVQWHPEFSFAVNENSRKIFRQFVASC